MLYNRHLKHILDTLFQLLCQRSENQLKENSAKL